MRDINLMPEEVKPASASKPEVGMKKTKMAKVVFIFAAVLIILVVSLFSPKIYLQSLKSQAVVIQTEIGSDKYTEVKAVNSQIAEIQTTLDNKKDVINSIGEGAQVSEMLNYAQQALPKGVSISDLQHSEKQLVIAGTTKDRTAVAEYIANLNRQVFFQGFVSTVTYSYGETNSILEYQINLTKPGKEV